jgi:hypothetical protein
MRPIISTIAALALALPTTFSSGSVGTVIAFAVPTALVTMMGEPAEARGGGGGRGGGGRAGRGGGGGRSVGNTRHNGNQSVNRNVNRNVNKNVNRNIDVDVNHRHNNNLGAAVVTGLAIGAVVNSISNSSSCATHVYSEISYQYCDGVWYQPRYSGSNVTYIVVNNPG